MSLLNVVTASGVTYTTGVGGANGTSVGTGKEPYDNIWTSPYYGYGGAGLPTTGNAYATFIATIASQVIVGASYMFRTQTYGVTFPSGGTGTWSGALSFYYSGGWNVIQSSSGQNSSTLKVISLSTSGSWSGVTAVRATCTGRAAGDLLCFFVEQIAECQAYASGGKGVVTFI